LITKNDVEAAAKDTKTSDAPKSVVKDGLHLQGGVHLHAVGAHLQGGPQHKDTVSGNTRVFNKIGKATAKAMTLSKTTIPHVYYQVEVDASVLIERRNQLEKAVSYNALLIDAVASSLKEFPYLASRYSEEGRILSEMLNIGLAVARGDDLLVPVVSDAGSKDIFGIEKDINVLVEKVKNNKLSQQDISGGVFTITNLGGFGIDSFSAVINPPEAGILAVGRITDKAIVVDGEICVRPVMCLTLSADHRIVNGVYAASFLSTLKKKIERT
jgi:pyruvate dehydrogenase E2 component (dihydrolipoamide acetyltransferase)